MAIERRLSRTMFLAEEVVELRQPCFTPMGLFEPGRYRAKDLPDTAFEMGLVDPVGDDNNPPAADSPTL